MELNPRWEFSDAADELRWREACRQMAAAVI